LKDGTRSSVVKLTKRVGITTEKVVVIEPGLSFPPRLSASRVYLFDESKLRAFDVIPSMQN